MILIAICEDAHEGAFHCLEQAVDIQPVYRFYIPYDVSCDMAYSASSLFSSLSTYTPISRNPGTV